MAVQETPSEETLIEQVKTNVKKRFEIMVKKYSRKRNIRTLVKNIAIVILIIMICWYEVENRKIDSILYSDDRALCEEEVRDINTSLVEIASKYLNEYDPDMAGIDMDSSGAWLLTISSNIGSLDEHDIVNFNKFINCSTKFSWTHPKNNLYSYWIEKDNKVIKKGPSAHYHKKEDEIIPDPGEHQKHRQALRKSRRHFNLHQKSELSNGDIRRIKTSVNGSKYRLEYLFNDNICQKGGPPHVCKFEKEARIVYRAHIKMLYPFLGDFHLATVSAGVLHGLEHNTLRTVIVVGGPSSRFHGTSRIVNALLTPVVKYLKVSEASVKKLYRHWSEEIHVSVKIMQHLVHG